MVVLMRNDLGLGVGRNENKRGAKAVGVGVREGARGARWGRDVVVPASPVIPGDDDGRVLPEGTLADGVDDGCYPGWAVVLVAEVVGVLCGGNYPGDCRELSVLNVGDYLGAGAFDDDLWVRARPVGAAAGVAVGIAGGLAHVRDRVGRGRDRALFRCVIFPGETSGIEHVGEGGMLETFRAGKLPEV